jgi:hypothetical protein
MIAFAQPLPLVAWHRNRNVPLSEGWIAESLKLSARRAGRGDWTHAEEVARAIAFFLSQDYNGSVISTAELRELMRRSLQGIGCTDIVPHLGLAAPRVSIYLPDLARRSAIELVFFHQLRQRLHEALEVVVQGIRLEDLRKCVKILDGSRKWNRACQHLGDEIVTFSRQHLATTGHSHIELAVF